jgi:hypothetical protein
LASGLNIVAVDAWRRSVVVEALGGLFLSVVINIFQIEGVNMPRKKAKEREADVDEKVGAAARDDVDADGRDCRG